MEDHPGSIHQVGAVVLGAGMSRRMGKPKLLLPWGETTIIGQIVSALQSGGALPVTVVVGAEKQAIETALAGSDARIIVNPDYERSEMLRSLKIGLESQPDAVEAILVTLGDQPEIEPGVVRAVIRVYHERREPLIIPSFQKHRGHPWLLDRRLWEEVFALSEEKTLRDFLNAHLAQIHYLNVNTPSILRDLDTLEEYRAARPPTSKPPR